MIRPELDPRYCSADGCRALALETDRQARSARLLAKRHESWSRALRARAEKIEEAELHDLEAKIARMQADGVANPEHTENRLDPLFSWMFGAARF